MNLPSLLLSSEHLELTKPNVLVGVLRIADVLSLATFFKSS